MQSVNPSLILSKNFQEVTRTAGILRQCILSPNGCRNADSKQNIENKERDKEYLCEPDGLVWSVNILSYGVLILYHLICVFILKLSVVDTLLSLSNFPLEGDDGYQGNTSNCQLQA